MSNLNHLNVMTMIGVCIDGNETPYLVMPYMSQGSLLSYLRKHREELTISNMEETADKVNNLLS